MHGKHAFQRSHSRQHERLELTDFPRHVVEFHSDVHKFLYCHLVANLFQLAVGLIQTREVFKKKKIHESAFQRFAQNPQSLVLWCAEMFDRSLSEKIAQAGNLIDIEHENRPILPHDYRWFE